MKERRKTCKSETMSNKRVECVCVLLQRGKERSGTGYVAHNDEGSVRVCG